MKDKFYIFSLIAYLFLALFVCSEKTEGQAISGKNEPKLTPKKEADKKIIIGLNQNWSYFPSLDNSKMIANIKQLMPQMIRYPGGTVTHSWDWRKGVMTTRKTKVPHPIANVKRFSDLTGAKIIFVLDIVNSLLEDQIEMLKTAQKSGIPIDYVELGNELYLRGKGYEVKFPTGRDYGNAARIWTTKVKEEFPKAKVAALLLARAVNPNNKRMSQWNEQVLATTRDVVDAYTYHIYIGENGGTIEATKKNFEDVVKRDNLSKKEIWITEYGNQKDETHPDYLKELEQLADFIESFPNVAISLNHQIVGSNKNKLTKDGNAFTPEGELFVKRAGNLKIP